MTGTQLVHSGRGLGRGTLGMNLTVEDPSKACSQVALFILLVSTWK